jgi:hypothetical protein
VEWPRGGCEARAPGPDEVQDDRCLWRTWSRAHSICDGTNTSKDSYTTDGVRDGSTPAPPVLTGTSPKAGGRTTNGLTWVENLAADVGAKIMDYAVGGDVVNVTLWPSKSTADDFVSQVVRFLAQDNGLDPATTLYTSFFGINDWSAAKTDGDHLPEAAADYLTLVEKLRGPPTNAQYWLALDDYGRGTEDAKGDAYKQAVFDGFGQMGTHSGHAQKLEYAFVDLKTLWNGVLGATPGYEAFGYASDGACAVNSSSIAGACADPDHTFYWIAGHPSKQTHRIMADYVEQVLYRC